MLTFSGVCGERERERRKRERVKERREGAEGTERKGGIILTFLLAYIYKGEREFDYESALDALGGLHTQWRAITAIIMLTFSGVCGERERELQREERGEGQRVRVGSS